VQSASKKQKNTVFRSESQLVRRLVGILETNATPWGRVQTLTEWDYRTGVTDVLARNRRNELIAFEAKLTDWRRACQQAYRNTTFAVRAYVVLPEAVANRVQACGELFARYGVGLCALSSRELSVLIEARPTQPLMEWLTTHAHSTFDRMFDVRTGFGGRRRARLRAA